MSYVNLASNVFSNVNVGGVLSASNGLANSNTIIGQAGHTTSMALDCLNYTNINYGTGVYTDWYLPAIGEMMCVVKNRVIIDNAIPVLGATGLFTGTVLDIYSSRDYYSNGRKSSYISNWFPY